MKKIILLAVVITLGAIYVSNQKSKVKYVDMPCPTCGSDEVLDFGKTIEGEQKAHCYDCGQEFTISDSEF